MNIIQLKVPQADCARNIKRQIDAGKKIYKNAKSGKLSLSKFRTKYLQWTSDTEAILTASFTPGNFLDSGPKSNFSSSNIKKILPLIVDPDAWTEDSVTDVLEDMDNKINSLKNTLGTLSLYAPRDKESPNEMPVDPNGPIFLVHGRDIGSMETVRRFLERCTSRPVTVLADQPNMGQDILGKLLTNAQKAAFAVVLLTADDIGGLSGEQTNPRARQNVVFELGLFIALLGRERVAVLNDPSVELPTDYLGSAYISLEDNTWQSKLVRELKSAKIEASLDKTL
ncbi:TIR domain-containing protein [Dermabacteraceae bacterium P13264]